MKSKEVRKVQESSRQKRENGRKPNMPKKKTLNVNQNSKVELSKTEHALISSA